MQNLRILGKKSEVDGFDGAEVFLKSTISELKKFKQPEINPK